MKNILYVVIPCYNEEEVLPETAKRLKEKMVSLMVKGKIDENSRVVFVNDGSKDKTWEIICDFHKADCLFSGINLSKNRGHQNALLAGLLTVNDNADMVISMDADLQDDINAMDEMIDKYLNGAEIVYGVRSKRKTDSFFKRFTAEGFYRIMNLLGANVVFNHADYRLMSKRAIEGLSEFKETNLFLRGIIPMIGYPTDTVMYERNERFAGESKYPLKKMLAFAFEGITSLSIKPIRFIALLGALFSAASGAMLIYILVRYFTGHVVVGWTSVIISVWGIGGLLLLSIGIVGEYIGKIYLETKARPRFIIEKFLNDDGNQEDK
ncbi:MAG: glycosyltransferase family 2 protein [Oscillospiraceae bacterium]